MDPLAPGDLQSRCPHGPGAEPGRAVWVLFLLRGSIGLVVEMLLLLILEGSYGSTIRTEHHSPQFCQHVDYSDISSAQLAEAQAATVPRIEAIL